ncbi:acyl-CoA dehydrogenase domain protein [Desulfarculus baarsii DSM 2075]|uniref:Acyl-CoA dehydrogenase domain protein n=1 Tax=Desulfarculus baarsii (strain ATCC 33931 / DSM 2075 / LMG 7858 / VKM B-1802 / 2st14) TaxID=644282 RepID=E1QE91_DESB2|nr:acyl-CoA dehydrogenase family protein [Desulfarculus baarsii]ADK83877.1 acyl-CoA dehydrogenase domain protein [Desulfarculus baarsii DSM 2075]
MSLPDRANPYNFDEIIGQIQGFNYYADDPFLQKALERHAGAEFPALDQALRRFDPLVSQRWRKMADEIARPDVLPVLQNYDAHNRRIDRLVRPETTKILEREIFGQGLFAAATPPWLGMVKRYLLHQNGEFGVMCPIACTEGLVALADQFPEGRHPAVQRILDHCKEGFDGDFGVGAQFMSEIQGGSDIPANLLEAVPAGDHYLLHGSKFFCSAMQADYAVVTAKVSGGEKPGAFIVPAWLPGDKEREKRNACRINRIKWKMGTAELPTAEVEYDGAVAYAVGPTDRGVANAVGVVLTLSRLTVGFSSAAAMVRAAREAGLYSQFRDVFGQKICQTPLAAHQLRGMINTSRRTTAAAFKVFGLFVSLGRRLQGGLDSNEPLAMRRKRFLLRELIIIQKLVTAFEAPEVIRQAMSIFGGHGVIEDFVSLPRLYRDAAVNELWEGPRNVLLMQALRDLLRVQGWYPAADFVADMLAGAQPARVAELAAELAGFMADPPAVEATAQSMARAAQWERLVEELFHAYQDQALAEIGPAPIVSRELISFPAIWD